MENKRIFAFAIDFLITSLIQAVLMISLIMSKIITNQLDISTIPFAILGITYISMLYMIFRDCFGSKSIGKRILKLKIVSIETQEQAALVKRFVRNITWILGPLEIIYYLLTKKRLGDHISKTKVIS